MPESPRPLPPRPLPPLSRHFPPPPPLAPKPRGLWRTTPPAIFPPMMGLFGLGLSWRALAEHSGIAALAPVGEVILGATLLLALFGILAWMSKPLRRPGVVLDEMRALPGRAGLAAMALTLVLGAAALAPHAPQGAQVLVWLGVVLLALVGGLTAWTLLTGPTEQRMVTPVFHLTYVGYILAPLSLVRLGQNDLATLVLAVTVPVAVTIWAISLRQLAQRVPPAPLRPLLAIHLAPVSLFAIVSALTGHTTLAAGFALLALAILVSLLASLRWLLEAGFTPLWGALTFPLAACATAMMLALGTPGLWLGSALLLGASALNPWVATRVLQSWAKGDLAARTNAATA